MFAVVLARLRQRIGGGAVQRGIRLSPRRTGQRMRQHPAAGLFDQQFGRRPAKQPAGAGIHLWQGHLKRGHAVIRCQPRQQGVDRHRTCGFDQQAAGQNDLFQGLRRARPGRHDVKRAGHGTGIGARIGFGRQPPSRQFQRRHRRLGRRRLDLRHLVVSQRRTPPTPGLSRIAPQTTYRLVTGSGSSTARPPRPSSSSTTAAAVTVAPAACSRYPRKRNSSPAA